jgi:predicted enzyme related to lactoylglutathione lyase
MTMTQAANIDHFDIAGADIGALAPFYADLFGWTIHPRGPGYAQVKTPDLRGALVEAPEASLTIGVVVEALDVVLEQVAAHGGTVIMPPTDNGWVRKAQVRDPAGNMLTLIQK